MAKGVDFNHELYSLLSDDGVQSIDESQFPEWDILKEMERQGRRKQYEKTPERLAKRRSYGEKRVRVQKWMEEHPEEVKKLEGKVS